MRNNKSNKGFTLIELLIVIAIIGILAAVLIPNLLAARNRANDTAAQTYLRDAVTFQEIHQIDNNLYATAETALNTIGLRTLATTDPITFTIVAADATGYCMWAEHSGGSTAAGGGLTRFYATASSGITQIACTTAG